MFPQFEVSWRKAIPVCIAGKRLDGIQQGQVLPINSCATCYKQLQLFHQTQTTTESFELQPQLMDIGVRSLFGKSITLTKKTRKAF